MVTATSQNCYYDYHMLLWYEVHLVRNFWKIWDLAEEVAAEQWEWALGERCGLQSCSAAFSEPCHHQEGPLPRMGPQDFILMTPEVKSQDTETGHRDSLQSPFISTPGSLSNIEVLSTRF